MLFRHFAQAVSEVFRYFARTDSEALAAFSELLLLAEQAGGKYLMCSRLMLRRVYSPEQFLLPESAYGLSLLLVLSPDR